MRVKWIVAILCAASGACTGGVARVDSEKLEALLAAPKFVATARYTGIDTPEDLGPLTAIVNRAISDVLEMPEPRDAGRVRERLRRVGKDVAYFATEDREQAYRYAVQTWRAAGFTSESELFSGSDEELLAPF
jgi:hypothetical protein